jgi:hypothetical protein
MAVTPTPPTRNGRLLNFPELSVRPEPVVAKKRAFFHRLMAKEELEKHNERFRSHSPSETPPANRRLISPSPMFSHSWSLLSPSCVALWTSVVPWCKQNHAQSHIHTYTQSHTYTHTMLS